MKSIKLVIGSGGIADKGWINTEQDKLDLLKPSQWHNYFSIASIDNIVAEHVWEHLTLEEGIKAANTCYLFLKENGRLRVAVPDGLNPDLDYINKVKPPGYRHKILYTYKTLSNVFEQAGFKINLLEYFDENKGIHINKMSIEDGRIRRSRNFDPDYKYNSIVLDAIKI